VKSRFFRKDGKFFVETDGPDGKLAVLEMVNYAMMFGDGPIKTFSLRGVKDNPPYLRDERLLTLDDTVEFFNLVLGDKLTPEEKRDLVAFLRAL
jgi:cytochrome c peroxidase